MIDSMTFQARQVAVGVVAIGLLVGTLTIFNKSRIQLQTSTRFDPAQLRLGQELGDWTVTSIGPANAKVPIELRCATRSCNYEINMTGSVKLVGHVEQDPVFATYTLALTSGASKLPYASAMEGPTSTVCVDKGDQSLARARKDEVRVHAYELTVRAYPSDGCDRSVNIDPL